MLATTLLFVRFWRRTSDVFFLLLAFAFATDTVSRTAPGFTLVSNEVELAVFAVIIAAITIHNRSR
jgi:hypothetical protein